MKPNHRLPVDIFIMLHTLHLLDYAERIGHPVPEDLEDKIWASAGRVVLKHLFDPEFVWFPTFSLAT